MSLYLVIRLRGRMGLSPEHLDTLARMNIPAKHNAALIIDTPSNKGMLNKVTDYVTWGEIDNASLVALLKKRGRLPADERITEDFLMSNGMGTFEEVAAKIMENGKVPEPIKRTFRLTPPSGGFKKHITRHIKSGGELGYRGAAIAELVKKMI